MLHSPTMLCTPVPKVLQILYLYKVSFAFLTPFPFYSSINTFLKSQIFYIVNLWFCQDRVKNFTYSHYPLYHIRLPISTQHYRDMQYNLLHFHHHCIMRNTCFKKLIWNSNKALFFIKSHRLLLCMNTNFIARKMSFY